MCCPVINNFVYLLYKMIVIIMYIPCYNNFYNSKTIIICTSLYITIYIFVYHTHHSYRSLSAFFGHLHVYLKLWLELMCHKLKKVQGQKHSIVKCEVLTVSIMLNQLLN